MIETSADRSAFVVRKILAGTGMVTPTRPLEVRYNGKVERLVPGQARLAANHELVRSRPAAFRACDASDGATRDRLRSMGGRTATRTTVRPRATAGGLNRPSTTFRLPTSGPSTNVLPFRLP